MQDVQNRLPFTLNYNSVPTLAQASGVWEHANLFINGYLGRPSDYQGETGALRVIETDIAVNYCMYWHLEDYAPYYRFTADQKKILDNYKSDSLVRHGNFNFDEY